MVIKLCNFPIEFLQNYIQNKKLPILEKYVYKVALKLRKSPIVHSNNVGTYILTSYTDFKLVTLLKILQYS